MQGSHCVVVGEQKPEGSRRQRVTLGGLKVLGGSSQWENPYHFNNHLLPQEPPQWGLELVGRRQLVISPLTLQ